MKKNIALLGYMGAGKSTIGQYVAKELNATFVDLDLEIEQYVGKNIPTIFDAYGEYYFRKMEKRCLVDVIQKSNTILSLGGGTPCFYNNMQVLNESCITIYLKPDTTLLANRLELERDHRPILQYTDNVEEFIHKHLQEREPYYLKAHHIIEIQKDQSVGAISKLIIQKINQF